MFQSIYIVSKNKQLRERLSSQMNVSFPDFVVHEFGFSGAVRGLIQHNASVVIYDTDSLGAIPQGVIGLEGGHWLNLLSVVDEKVEMQSLVDGFSGVINVDTPIEQLPKIIRSLVLGQIWYSRKVTAFAIRQYQSKSLTSEEMLSFVIESLDLTHREKELTRLLLRGQSNQEIADHLSISIHTVKTHVSRILAKLNLSSRNDLHAAINADVLKNRSSASVLVY